MQFLVIACRYSLQQTPPPIIPQLRSQSNYADCSPLATQLAVAELERLTSHFIKDSIADSSTPRVYSSGHDLFQFLPKIQLATSPSSVATTNTVHGWFIPAIVLCINTIISLGGAILERITQKERSNQDKPLWKWAHHSMTPFLHTYTARLL